MVLIRGHHQYCIAQEKPASLGWITFAIFISPADGRIEPLGISLWNFLIKSFKMEAEGFIKPFAGSGKEDQAAGQDFIFIYAPFLLRFMRGYRSRIDLSIRCKYE